MATVGAEVVGQKWGWTSHPRRSGCCGSGGRSGQGGKAGQGRHQGRRHLCQDEGNGAICCQLLQSWKENTKSNIGALSDAGIQGEAALSQVKAMTQETMSTLAALHNPDMIVGGADAVSDFGDRGVNSSIDGQWKDRIDDLDKAAE